MKIYIAGPITGYTPEEFHKRFDDFQALCEQHFKNIQERLDALCENLKDIDPTSQRMYEMYANVVRKNVIPEFVNPTMICQDDWDWFHCMEVCVEALTDCDAIILLNGWKESKGATCEYYIAKSLGKLILYEDTIWNDIKLLGMM